MALVCWSTGVNALPAGAGPTCCVARVPALDSLMTHTPYHYYIGELFLHLVCWQCAWLVNAVVQRRLQATQ